MELLTARCFSGLPVDIYANDSDFCFLGGQIMQLLSYRNPEYTLKNIHERNYKYLQDLSLELENLSSDRIVERQSGLLRQLEARDFSRVRLHLTNPSEALKSLYDSEKMTLSNTDGHSGQRGGAQFFNLINEPGLYKLIFKSRKPEAKKFQDWVFYEVLPEIRNTGNFNGRKRLSLPETKFYLAEDIAAELNIALSTLLGRASEKNLLIYGFTKDCDWYFTEEGRQKLLHETWL